MTGRRVKEEVLGDKEDRCHLRRKRKRKKRRRESRRRRSRRRWRRKREERERDSAESEFKAFCFLTDPISKLRKQSGNCLHHIVKDRGMN